MNLLKLLTTTACRSTVVGLCAFSTLLAQTATTKEQILSMTKAGLPDDVIVAKIKAGPLTTKMEVADLIGLKSDGVSDGVLRALMDSGTSASSATSPAVDIDDPLSPHDPGVYVLGTSHDGKRKMVQIERAGSNRAKTANVWGAAFSYGLSKAKVKSELPGRRAAMRVSEVRPEFYMYFPPTGNLGASDTISSPSQFALLSLEVKKETRETAIGKWGLGSASAGADEKRTVKFRADKIRPYAYRVTPEASLPGGEYAFIATSGMGGASAAPTVVIFDFGVDQ